jgi:hypothetical protein
MHGSIVAAPVTCPFTIVSPGRVIPARPDTSSLYVVRLKKAPSCTDGRDICLSRMLVSKSRAAGRRAEKAWRRRREHNRAAMRCDATRRDATDESGNTFPSSSSGSISICLLRLGCTCTPSNARQPCVQ